MNFFMRKRSLPQSGLSGVSGEVGPGSKVISDPAKAIESKRMARTIRESPSRSISLTNVRFFYEAGDSDSSLRKNRKLISKYLGRVGRQAGLQLSLDSYGFCYIPFRIFLIMLEVPKDDPGQLHIYTMIFDLSRSKGETRARKKVAAMQLRGISLGKKGCTITVDEDEVHLCYSRPIKGLSYCEMIECLEDFMETALNTNSDLAALAG
jgi:hypothetical protein